MQVHQLLKEDRNKIMANWVEAVLSQLPAAREHNLTALKNNLPDLIDIMSNALVDTDEVFEISFEHGKMRAAFDNYSLIHVIREYHIFRKVLFDYIEERVPLSIKERNILLHAIEVVIEQSAEVFFQIRSKAAVDARELAEAGLHQLKEDETLRNRFIEGLTHDLRNPMNNIKLILELFKQELSSAEYDLLMMMERNVQRSVTLLNNLMDITMVAAGIGLPVKPEESDIQKHIEDYLAGSTLFREGRLQVEFSKTPVTGMWDAHALMRAVDNLIQNADRYGVPEKKITLGVEKRTQEVKIYVHNFGPAIPEAEQKNIFRRLYKLNQHNQVGYGLGLAIVNEVAEIHGGHVELQSDEADGTRFTIVLPLGQH